MNVFSFSKKNERQFRNKITYFSFCLSVFVIGIHTYNVEVYELTMRTDLLSRVTVFLENYIKSLSGICVPFFFLISGYLFFRTFEWSKLIQKYKSRICTIISPFMIWCSIYYVYYCVLSRVPVVKEYINGGASIPVSLQTWGAWLWEDSYYTLWFLKELIVLIICTPIIAIVIKNYKYVPVGMLALGISLLHVLQVFPFDFFTFNIYYLLGAYIGTNHKEAPLKECLGLTYIGRFSLIGVLIWYLYGLTSGVEANELVIIWACISVWFAFDGIEYESMPKWWFGISFYIYCIHDIVLEAFEKIFLLVFGNGSIFALLDFVFMPIIIVAICIFSAMILRKYLPALWKLLTGNRVGLKI